MDILGILGLIFAATAISVLVYEHQTDVLRGPYIERDAPPRRKVATFDPARAFVGAVIDRLNWSARHAVYLACLVG